MSQKDRRRKTSHRPRSSRAKGRPKHPGAILPAPHLVQTPGEFTSMMAMLRTRSLLAVDTESDSLYRYYPRVCLVQVSVTLPEEEATPTHADPCPTVDYLVDVLRLDNIDPLGELFADPQVEVILHAAENDLRLFQRDFGFNITNIFDTQLAARILGRRGVGLAAILRDEFGVVSDKRMQRTNWGRRPLTPEQMTYAQIDTHYLPALRERQIAALREAGRWEEAQEAFHLLELLRYEAPDTERTFWSMKGVRDVETEDLAVLEGLWQWRERLAQRLDRPPFKVLRDDVLVSLAGQRPRTMKELARVPGLAAHQIQRFGSDLLDAIRDAAQRPTPEPPVFNHRTERQFSPSEQRKYDALRAWRTKLAQERGVDPDIVFSNDILAQIAVLAPRTVEELASLPAIGPWKARTYGPTILELLNGNK